MLSRSAQLIRYLVESVAGAGRTQIVKFLYLADLESRRHLGRPLSTFDYIWYDYGPFDSEILSQLDQLCHKGYLKTDCVCYSGDKYAYRYFATDKSASREFGKEETAILNYVVRNYGSTPLQTLLDDIVCQTKPMEDAKERNALGCQLRMELVDNEARIPGLELEQVIESVEELDRGKGRRFQDILADSKN